MALVEKVTTRDTFTQSGELVPAGTRITVDEAKLGDAARPEARAEDDFSNLVDPGEGAEVVIAAVAPIAPTGPNPTVPQQLAPGTRQTAAGYQNGDQFLTAEGSKLAKHAGKALSAGEEAVVEEEGVQRTQSSNDAPALSGMTKDELIATAEAEGVDLSDASNNDERREAIERARG